jgi:hypothetical protein
MRIAKGLPNWVVISTVAMLLAVGLIAMAVLLLADKQGNSGTHLMAMADVRAVTRSSQHG